MVAKGARRDHQAMVRLDDATNARWRAEADAHHEGNLASFIRITVNGALDAKESK